MNLNKLMNIVLSKTSNWTKKEGETICDKGLVSNVGSKQIKNIYNIYGRVNNDNASKEYYTHLKINIKDEILDECKCSCELFKENYIQNKAFLCPHLIATILKFNKLASKKLQHTNTCMNEPCNSGDIIIKKLMNKENTDNKLSIKVKLTYVKTSSLDYYEAEFRLGKNNGILIKDLENFIYKKASGKSIIFSNELIYNPEIHFFSEEDDDLIDYIEEYINLKTEFTKNENKTISINNRTVKILPNNLRSFLNVIKGKLIVFKYNYIEYHVKILNEQLPIGFTLKNLEDKFILTTKKKFPVPLNKNKSVYFYEGNIYIPDKNQIKFYNPFYNKLIEFNELSFKAEVKTLRELLYILKQISKDVHIHESMKRYTDKLLEVESYLNKTNDKINCNIKLRYGEELLDFIKDQDKITLIERDLKKERTIENCLSKNGFIKRHNEFEFIGNDNNLYSFLKNGIKELKSFGELYINDEFKTLKLYDFSFIDAKISENNYGIVLQYNFENIDAREYKNIFQAFNENKAFFRTKSNVFIDFTDEKINCFLELLGNIDNKFYEKDTIKIENNRLNYVNEFIRKNKIKYIKGKEILNDVIKRLIELKNVEYEEPSNLNGNLREYQLMGYRWMRNLSDMGLGGILADEMGLGKTIQTISFILSQKKSKVLLVVPTSLIYNWKNEFEKFAPILKIGIIHGLLEERIQILKNREEYDVLITTYGTLRNDFDLYQNIIFDYCIIDEGQNIKNLKSQTTRKLKSIQAKVRFALTGTPIENNLMELWSIFDFILPGHLYSEDIFNNKFIINYNKNAKDLKSLIRPFILRREKSDVLNDLPDKIEKKFLVEMNKKQMELYQSYIKEIRKNLNSNKEDKITILSYLTKLRQLCLDPTLLCDDYTGGSSKIQVAVDMVKDAVENNKKILLFSQFTSVLKNICKILDENEIQYLYLDGDTKAIKRIEMVDHFNENNNINVFLISLKAGGTGLNLTSASRVIHFDPWWNPAIEDQATDRAHRIGQKNIVEVIKLVAERTIEEKIIKLQNEKKELINDVMNGDLKDHSILSKLSNDELLELFN